MIHTHALMKNGYALPLQTRGELSISVTFQVNQGVNFTTFHVRLFRNQLNMGFARVPYLSFFY